MYNPINAVYLINHKYLHQRNISWTDRHNTYQPCAEVLTGYLVHYTLVEAVGGYPIDHVMAFLVTSYHAVTVAFPDDYLAVPFAVHIPVTSTNSIPHCAVDC